MTRLKSRRCHPVVRRIEYVVPVSGAEISAADQTACIYPVALVERMQQPLRLLRWGGVRMLAQAGQTATSHPDRAARVTSAASTTLYLSFGIQS